MHDCDRWQHPPEELRHGLEGRPRPRPHPHPQPHHSLGLSSSTCRVTPGFAGVPACCSTPAAKHRGRMGSPPPDAGTGREGRLSRPCCPALYLTLQHQPCQGHLLAVWRQESAIIHARVSTSSPSSRAIPAQRSALSTHEASSHTGHDRCPTTTRNPVADPFQKLPALSPSSTLINLD